MKLKSIIFLFFMISILFVYPAESKMLGKNQAVYSGKFKKITTLKDPCELSINNRIFLISRTSDNKLFKKAEKLIRKDVKIIYDKDNYFITFIELSQQPLKY